MTFSRQNQVCTHWNCIITSVETGGALLSAMFFLLVEISQIFMFLPAIEQSICNVFWPTTGGRPALTCTHRCISREHLLQCEVCMFSSVLLSRFTWSRTGYWNLFLGVNVSLYYKKLRTYDKQGLMIKRDEQQQITCWNIWYHWYSGKSGSRCVLEQEKKKITCTWLHK